MARLVIVSNRVADPRKPSAGGLAVALGEVLQPAGGLWFGWSGHIAEPAPNQRPHMQQAGALTLATVDLTQEEHDGYYLGYSNGVLWPVFHYRLDLADLDAGYVGTYRRVNQMFARQLSSLLRPDDIVWVHDYHLIPLGLELRALGCKQRMGFFLHIPMPAPLLLAAIPQAEWLVRCLCAYNLVGFQSQADLLHFGRYIVAEAGAEPLGGQRWRAFGRTVEAGSFPIGIDVNAFAALTHAAEARDMYERMRQAYAGRRILLGVERLDYSKGLPQRIKAFAKLLRAYPENIRSTTLIQIVSPSREALDSYTELRQQLESLTGALNGDYGELDWVPVRYMHRNVARRRLPGLYRLARVALVTPLRDGMNLVAKEFIAAQDPADPGVLVLSRFAGAAEQLKEALLVNPYDTDGTCETMQQALQMPLHERQRRHQKLLERIRAQDLHWWRQTFLDALAATRIEGNGAQLAVAA
jgi:trehalose 6-phosphate synthase